MLALLQKAIDSLVESKGLDPETGDCLDTAVACALAALESGTDACVDVLERYEDGERVAVVHAVCRSSASYIGWSKSVMNDLNEHVDFLRRSDDWEEQRAYHAGDTDTLDALATRDYAISSYRVDDGVEQFVQMITNTYEDNMKNNRKERLFNPVRAFDYLAFLQAEIGLSNKMPSSGRRSQHGMSM